MTKFRKADPAARRAVVLILAVGTCVGVLSIAAFTRYRFHLRDWVLADRTQRVTPVFLVLTALVSGPLLGLAVYLWSLGGRIVRTRESPPPGLRAIRDTSIVTGDRAVSRGRLVKLLAAGLGLAAIVFVVLLWRLELGAEDFSTDVARLASAKGCRAEPSNYVAGYFETEDPLSGVFWCRANLDDLDPRYLIVVVDRHPGRRLSCPDTMESVNRPLGLWIVRDAQVPLSSFHFPSEWSRVGPVSRLATGPVIDTGDGGIGEQWICHEGAWLVHVYH